MWRLAKIFFLINNCVYFQIRLMSLSFFFGMSVTMTVSAWCMQVSSALLSHLAKIRWTDIVKKLGGWVRLMFKNNSGISLIFPFIESASYVRGILGRG